jgi:hypothetical protein
MGFNKRHLPAKHILQQMVYDHGVEWVVKNYASADVLIGDGDSVDYIYELQILVNNNIKDPYFKNNLNK